MHNDGVRRKGTCLWMIAFAMIYFSFLAIDIRMVGWGWASDILRYCGMLLLFAFALAGYPTQAGGADVAAMNIAAIGVAATDVDSARARANRGIYIALLAALGFTLLADAALLFTEWHIAGLLCFCGAQLCHIRRFAPRVFPIAALAALGVTCLILAMDTGGFVADKKHMVATLYGVLLLIATVTAYVTREPGRVRTLRRVGMTLFVLCDIHVALYNMLPAGHPYARSAGIWIWAFYYPSQIALACAERINR